jgi:hypothetical protein
LLVAQTVETDAQTSGANRNATRNSTNVARVFACRPAVASVSASSGTEAGGTTVTVSGTCFTGATSVTFGGVAGTSLGSVTSTSLSIVTPAISSSTTFPSRSVNNDYRDHALSSTAADNDVVVAVTGPGGTGTLSAGYRYTSELKRIAGANYSNEYRANDPRITIATGVSSWPDYNNNCALTQATGSAQPTFSASSFNSGPGVTGDANDDRLIGTLTSTIASGKRPYMMIVFARVSGATQYVAALRDAANTGSWIDLYYLTVWGIDRKGSDAQEQKSTAISTDTNRHLIEIGLTASGTNAIVVDGSGTNTTKTTASGTTIDTLELFAITNIAKSNVRIAAVLVFSDEPDATTKANARTAYKASTWIGYSSSSLGLP